jgi:hypothetical protein
MRHIEQMDQSDRGFANGDHTGNTPIVGRLLPVGSLR